MQPLPAATKTRDSAQRLSTQACAREIFQTVPLVMGVLRQEMRSHREPGLSVPQFRTLVLLRQSPDASLSMAAEHLGSSLPAASRIVAGLVARKLVVRKGGDDDRRRLRLSLTSRGQAVLSRAIDATVASFMERIAPLDEDQREAVVEALRLLQNVFGASRNGK